VLSCNPDGLDIEPGLYSPYHIDERCDGRPNEPGIVERLVDQMTDVTDLTPDQIEALNQCGARLGGPIRLDARKWSQWAVGLVAHEAGSFSGLKKKACCSGPGASPSDR
jgi:hypothetical protein